MSSEQSQRAAELLIASLQNPALYDHPVERFEVVETHISWVLLTGRRAYKIKKPVDLGFLDFTTLERRRFYCAEELRLNRRLAPELYLNVVPITGTPAAPRFGGGGSIIEYAVEMVQFPRAAQLDRLVEEGRIEARHMERLAADVAKFHGLALPVPDDEPYGGMEILRRHARDNFSELASCLRGATARAAFEHLQRWTEDSLRTHERAFAARRDGGCVRECHGDMHLSNMVLLDDRAVVFDCIEFSPELRWTDVMAEVAFLVMDLDSRAHPELGRRFLNCYLEYTGDYRGLVVLPHYLVYRSMVRAKVACIRSRQPGLDAPARRGAEERLEHHLDLAAAYTRERPQRALVITHGLSGSGKSWLARQLADASGAIHLRSDVERKRLHGRDPHASAAGAVGEAIYGSAATEHTYTRLAELARTVLDAGFPALVDATFLEHGWRERFHDLAHELDVPFRILAVQAPLAVLRERVRGRLRGPDEVSDADLAVLEHQRRSGEALTAAERATAVAVDTSLPPDIAALVRRVL